MPIYDYRCESCEKDFTVQASMHDPKPVQGPSCAGTCKIRKRFSRVYGQVAGANPAPVEQAKTQSVEKPSHVCSKYCDLHK